VKKEEKEKNVRKMSKGWKQISKEEKERSILATYPQLNLRGARGIVVRVESIHVKSSGLPTMKQVFQYWMINICLK
jgi:hypothetical protein